MYVIENKLVAIGFYVLPSRDGLLRSLSVLPSRPYGAQSAGGRDEGRGFDRKKGERR